jgi:translation initiation factor 2 beta subunit (eIF-2beta)/eIF-5
MSSFGFDKVKRPAEQEGERKLDLSGLTMQPPPPVPADKEQRAIEKGEKLGFKSREPSETKERKTEGKGRVMRLRERMPTRSIYVQGPASVLDRFVAYANELNADAYWEVLDKLLAEKGK